jgi:hypothetical protein
MLGNDGLPLISPGHVLSEGESGYRRFRASCRQRQPVFRDGQKPRAATYPGIDFAACASHLQATGTAAGRGRGCGGQAKAEDNI